MQTSWVRSQYRKRRLDCTYLTTGRTFRGRVSRAHFKSCRSFFVLPLAVCQPRWTWLFGLIHGGDTMEDLSRFADLIDETRRAFRQDVSYGVLIARKAQRLMELRKLASLRSILRTQSQAAEMACRMSNVSSCGVREPCGTGSCPFASGVFRNITLNGHISERNVQIRPVPSNSSTYSIEDALRSFSRLSSS
jgi:hypothetical protein